MSAPSRLRQRGGRWYFYYRNPATGLQREESCHTGDLASARRFASKRAGELGLAVPRLGLETVATFARGWLRDRAATGHASACDDERWCRLWILPMLGDRALHDLRPSDVVDWIADLERAGLAPRSVRNAHAVLSAMLTAAVRAEQMPANVAAAAMLPAGTLPVLRRPRASGARAGGAPSGGARRSAPEAVRDAVESLREASELYEASGAHAAAGLVEGYVERLGAWVERQ